jgi:hypothetical protein
MAGGGSGHLTSVPAGNLDAQLAAAKGKSQAEDAGLRTGSEGRDWCFIRIFHKRGKGTSQSVSYRFYNRGTTVPRFFERWIASKFGALD